MPTNRRVKLYSNLRDLNKPDVYSILLFALFNLKEDPSYTALCELFYILNRDDLINFLSLYGGTTLKVPTVRDLKLALNGLEIYRRVNLEEESLNPVLKDYVGEFTNQELLEMYKAIAGAVDKYDFHRDQNQE